MKILAFGASNNRNSINKKLASFVAKKVPANEIEILDLNDFECSIFSPERLMNEGIPNEIEQFLDKVISSDLIIISFAEYNGSYTPAFKNIFDWATTKNNQLFEGKNLILLSASNGARGALTVLESAVSRFPKHGAHIVGSLNVPFYNQQFDIHNNLTNDSLYKSINQIINKI